MLSAKKIDVFKVWYWRKFLRFPWTARRSNQSVRKSTLNSHWKNWCWSWSSNILATWCEHLTHWKRPWCWERLKAEGEEGDTGWDILMASPIQWTWTWANSRISWGTGKHAIHGFAKSWTQLGDWTTALKWALLHASVHNAMHVTQDSKAPPCSWSLPALLWFLFLVANLLLSFITTKHMW